MRSALRVLYATAESHPTHRPDVRVLFGEVLPRRGVRVDLVATAAPQPDGRIPDWPGGAAFLRGGGSRRRTLVADVLQQLRLFRLCRDGYDMLVVRDKPVLGLIGYAAARCAGVPFCYWMSYPLPEHFLWLSRQTGSDVGRLRRAWLGLRGLLGRASLARVLVPRADWLFVQSDAMACRLRAGPLKHARVTVVPMGVDVDAVPPPAPELPAALEGCRLAVYLGTLDRARDPQLLVDVALRIGQRMPAFRMLIIGEAEERSDHGWLQRYAISVGAMPYVHFTGRLPPREALALARRAEVGVSPVPRTALTEVGSPTKAVEYLACGLPVVCNDQPDQAYVVRASGGGLVAPLDADGFARAILSLLADPVAARAHARAGQAWVRRHRGYDVLGERVAMQLAALRADGPPSGATQLGARG